MRPTNFPDGFAEEPISAGIFNDDRFARALSALFDSDRQSLMTDVSGKAIAIHKLLTDEIRYDSTTVTFMGKYDKPDPEAVKLKRGHNKDFRPDCKQIVFGLDITADGHVALMIVSLVERKIRMNMVLLDIQMPHVGGEILLEKIGAEFPDIPVIIVTSSDEVEKAVTCMKNGAFDYIVKPADFDRLTASLTRAFELNRLKRENRELRQRLLTDGIENPNAFARIVTRNRQTPIFTVD